MPGLPICMR